MESEASNRRKEKDIDSFDNSYPIERNQAENESKKGEKYRSLETNIESIRY